MRPHIPSTSRVSPCRPAPRAVRSAPRHAALAVASMIAIASLACGGHSASLAPGDGGGGSGGESSSGGNAGSSSGGPSSSGGFAPGGSSSGATNPPPSLDASAPPPELGCPDAPPANGSACENQALICEYGSDPNLSCETLSVCQGQGWVTTSPAAGATCPTTLPGAGNCPSTPPTEGSGCPAGASCAYAQGICACTIPGPYQSGYQWTCEAPGTDCPQPRPRAGSACSARGLICEYGICGAPGDGPEVLTCAGGEWAVSQGVCGA